MRWKDRYCCPLEVGEIVITKSNRYSLHSTQYTITKCEKRGGWHVYISKVGDSRNIGEYDVETFVKYNESSAYKKDIDYNILQAFTQMR